MKYSIALIVLGAVLLIPAILFCLFLFHEFTGHAMFTVGLSESFQTKLIVSTLLGLASIVLGGLLGIRRGK